MLTEDRRGLVNILVDVRVNGVGEAWMASSMMSIKDDREADQSAVY